MTQLNNRTLISEDQLRSGDRCDRVPEPVDRLHELYGPEDTGEAGRILEVCQSRSTHNQPL